MGSEPQSGMGDIERYPRAECPEHPTASQAYLRGAFRCVECDRAVEDVEYVMVRADHWRGVVSALRRLENIVGKPTEATQPGSITAIVAEALDRLGGQ